MPDPTQPEVSPRRIMEMAWGFAPPLMLEAAVRLKVFDALQPGRWSSA